MPVSFDGFDQGQIGFLQQAFSLMQRASGKAKSSLLSGNLTAYRKWFDAKGTAHLMKVATIVNEADAAINGRPITFAKLDRPGVNVDTSNLCAYVFLVRSGQFLHHVGTGMRVLIVWSTHAAMDVSYLSETMYHELTHKVGSTTDVTYDQAACLQLAQSQPEQAVRNAENYNLFLGEFF